MDITQIIEENNRRKALLPHPADPETGRGCVGERTSVTIGGKTFWLPASLPARHYPLLESNPSLRFMHDFEYWAWRCVRIRHKLTGALVPFILNAPQRKVLEVLEADRLADKPLRIILLKARQWGGSALCYLLIYLNNANNQ